MCCPGRALRADLGVEEVGVTDARVKQMDVGAQGEGRVCMA